MRTSERRKATEQDFRIAAKAFFKDCQGDPDYPHKTWEEQLAEFKAPGTVTDEFIVFVAEANADIEKDMQ